MAEAEAEAEAENGHKRFMRPGGLGPVIPGPGRSRVPTEGSDPVSPSPRRRRAVPLVLGAVAALLLATACSDGDGEPSPAPPSPPTSSAPSSPESAGALRITTEDFAFSPADPEVGPGEKITVVNKDSAAHTVTATDGDAFDTGSIAGGESGTFTAPSEAGRYAFVCTFHPNMTGTLIVR